MPNAAPFAAPGNNDLQRLGTAAGFVTTKDFWTG